jgi:peptide deformylase
MQLLESPNNWLRKTTKPFDFDELDAVQLSGEMTRIMMDKQGIGLSANQVGIDAQIFVMRPLQHAEIKKPFAVINPIILEIGEEKINGPEGCLSHPGLVINVTRPNRLVAQFLDLDKKECILEFTGIDARCFLHEYDHLHGIEFVDRVSKLKLQMARKKLKKQMRKSHG